MRPAKYNNDPGNSIHALASSNTAAKDAYPSRDELVLGGRRDTVPLVIRYDV
jgi:hypothetical protein